MLQVNLAKFLLSKNKKDGGNPSQKTLRASDYHGVAKITKIPPPAVPPHIINTGDIRSSITQISLQLSTVPALPFSLVYSKPRRNDKVFQNAFRESLDEDGSTSQNSEKLLQNLRKV